MVLGGVNFQSAYIGLTAAWMYNGLSGKVICIQTPMKAAIWESKDSGLGFPRHRSTAGQLQDYRLDQYRGLLKESISWKTTMSCITDSRLIFLPEPLHFI